MNALPSISQALATLQIAIADYERLVEVIPIEAARGRALADAVCTGHPLPTDPKAAIDGFAIRCEEIAKYDALRIRAETAHRKRLVLHRGEAIYVAGGRTLPSGANTVVPSGRTEMTPSGMCVIGPVSKGEAVIEIGGELGSGETVLPAGTELRSSHVGLIASCGIDTVRVYRRPCVAVISTGDEIVLPGRPIHAGQSIDVNRYVIFSALAAWGAQPAMFPAGNDQSKLSATLRLAVTHCDAVILSGGTTKGSRAVAARSIRALTKAGVVVDGIKMQPGCPTILGAIESRPIVVLRGDPTAALIALHVVARPIVRSLCGRDSVGAQARYRTTDRPKVEWGGRPSCPVAIEGQTCRPIRIGPGYFKTFRDAGRRRSRPRSARPA